MKDNKKYEEMKDVKLFVGIDIGKEKHFISAVNKDGKTIISGFEILNTEKGFQSLINLLKNNGSTKEIAIAMEPTGHYWKSLGHFLKERDYKIYLVNPYHVKLSKELRDNRQRKTDKKDSLLISNLLKEGKYLNVLMLSGNYELLRRISILRDKISEDNKRAQIRLVTILDQYLPEYSRCFSELKGKTSLGLLKKYGITDLRFSEDREKIIKDIIILSKKRISKEKGIYIESILKNSIGLNTALSVAEMEVKIWIEQIESNLNKLKSIDLEIKKIIDETEESKYLLSIKGIGLITIANILGQTGAFKNYKSYKQIEKLAGLDLVESSSGKKTGKKEISKRGRDKLRCSLYQATITCLANNKDIKSKYDYKVKELKKNKMVALTSISIKILKIMFSLVKNRSFYESRKMG